VRGFVENPGSGQPGCREDDRVALAFPELADAGLDIAAERHEGQIRALSLQLDNTPPGGGADLGPSLQRLEIDAIDRHEHIPRICTHRDAKDAHSLRKRHVTGHVFERVHREVGFAADDDGFDFAHEKALAAHLGQGAVLNSIALRLHVHLFDVEVREMGA
jgi:hypothetical protein